MDFNSIKKMQQEGYSKVVSLREEILKKAFSGIIGREITPDDYKDFEKIVGEDNREWFRYKEQTFGYLQQKFEGFSVQVSFVKQLNLRLDYLIKRKRKKLLRKG